MNSYDIIRTSKSHHRVGLPRGGGGARAADYAKS